MRPPAGPNAAQTAHSTEEITRHIAEIRSATGASVAAVGRIEQTIGEINVISGAIAAAVEQQGAATAEIARNVAETATAANAMTGRITEVSVEAKETGQHAETVHGNTSALVSAVSELRTTVIRIVRGSTTGLDRRGSERLADDAPCRLEVAAAMHQAQLVTLSEGGASIADGPGLAQGDRGRLWVEGLDPPLPFVVRHVTDDALHVAFELAAGQADALRSMLARAGLQAAA